MKKFIILWVLLNSLFLAAQPPPVYVPTNSLTGWYSFSGNPNDLSGNGNNAIINGATLTTNAAGMPNSAYMFTPNNKIVTPIHPPSMVSGSLITSSAALFTWFNANTLGTSLGPNSADGLGHCLISSDSAGKGGSCIGVVNGSLTACVGVFWFRKAFQFAPGTWYHVGLNFNAATQVAELFVNAVSIGTFNVPPPNQNVFPCLYQMGFVSNPGTWNVPFNGKMDEVGIWHRKLSQCEITNLYNAAITCVTGINYPGAVDNALQLFPNPNNGSFALQLNEKAHFEIMNCTGRIIMSGELQPGDNRINLEAYPDGIYFISFQQNNLRQVSRIIVQH